MMLRTAFIAFCMGVCVQTEDLVSMLQTKRLIGNTSATKPVTVTVKTSGLNWGSVSSDKLTITFDGEDTEYNLGKMPDSGKTGNLQLHVALGADLTKFVIKAHGDDGWLASSIDIGGINVLSGDQWFGSKWYCQHNSYFRGGFPCQTSIRFNFETTVSVKTCDTEHAISGGDFYIQFDGDSQKRKLDTQMNDFIRAQTSTFILTHDARVNVQKFTVSTDQSDGLCITSILVNGHQAMGQGAIWIEKPCTTSHYDGTSCNPSYDFDLTSSMLPDYDFGLFIEGWANGYWANLCKAGYIFIATPAECESAANFVTEAGSRGIYKKGRAKGYQNSPAGCFMHTNAQAPAYRRVNFNPTNGAQSQQGRIICKKKPPDYDLNDGNACKAGYIFITTPAECETAASSVTEAGSPGIYFGNGKRREVSNRPTGCYMQTNANQTQTYRRVIFNHHTTGAPSDKAKIICKKKH